MITILSINKASEGLILKSSSLRYTWVFKINNSSHLVEFLEGSMGKKTLIIDSKEVTNERSFMGKFNEKFILDNVLFHLKPDDEDFDIYLYEKNIKLKDLLKKNNKKQQENQPQIPTNQDRGFYNNFNDLKNVNSKNNTNNFNSLKNGQISMSVRKPIEDFDFLQMDDIATKNNQKLEPQQKKLINKNNFDNFNFGKINKANNQLDAFENQNQKQQDFNFDQDFDNFENNPFNKENQIKKKLTPWEDNEFSSNFGFEQETITKKKYGIFDEKKKCVEVKVSQNDLFEDVFNKNFEKAVLIHDEEKKEYKMTIDEEKEDRIEDAFYTMEDFDLELEKNKKENAQLKSKFDIDPEEGFKKVKKGFKNLFKKTSKLVDKFETKCKNLVYSQKPEKNLEEFEETDKNQNRLTIGDDIQTFYGGMVN